MIFTPFLKKTNNVALFTLICLLVSNQKIHSQVGISTLNPDAMLDVVASDQRNPSNNDGILIPRVDAFPTTNPTASQHSMLVYLTTTVGANAPGFYYWDNTVTSWLPLGGSGNDDLDWYEEGTTTVPNDINDDIYTLGNVAIGKTIANNALDIVSTDGRAFQAVLSGNGAYGITSTGYLINSNSTDFSQHGLDAWVTGDGNGTQRGIRTVLNGDGTGFHVGMYASLSGNGDATIRGTNTDISNRGNGEHVGSVNLLTGIGNGRHMGTSNTLQGSGTGQHIGIQSSISGSGTGNHFGTINILNASGGGIKRGVYNTISGTGTGDLYGMHNIISNPQNNDQYGVYTFMNGAGNGTKYGVQNFINDTGSGLRYGTYNNIASFGNGTHYGAYNRVYNGSGESYGSYNDISGTGTVYGSYHSIVNFGSGDKYGVLSTISSSASGRQYAIHATALSTFDPDVYAGYFVGRVSFGDLSDRYVFPTNRGSAGQVLVTDASGVLTWQNASAIAARAVQSKLEALEEENRTLKTEIDETKDSLFRLKKRLEKLESLIEE